MTKEIRRRYRCECWTQDLTTGRRPALLASYGASTAPEADNRVAATLRTLTPALDPEISDEAWDWLCEGRIKARRACWCFGPCEVSVTQADLCITWTIRPVLLLSFAHRQGGQLPACVHDFKSPATDDWKPSII
ncbi:hypothetical protein ACWC09_16905 [Streptomyces sp. NPDC001617]